MFFFFSKDNSSLKKSWKNNIWDGHRERKFQLLPMYVQRMNPETRKEKKKKHNTIPLTAWCGTSDLVVICKLKKNNKCGRRGIMREEEKLRGRKKIDSLWLKCEGSDEEEENLWKIRSFWSCGGKTTVRFFRNIDRWIIKVESDSADWEICF